MGAAARILIIAVIFGVLPGCTSKLVKIDSKPAFAQIRINDEYVGRTPMYYKFSDKWHPWPIRKTEDYLVEASLPGHAAEPQYFPESPVGLDIGYVPDEIFFMMRPEDKPEEMDTVSGQER